MKRQFEDIINEWTETLLQVNRETNDITVIALVTRLGMLGQRLIYEANAVGMTDTATMAIAQAEAVCDDIDAVIEGIQQ